MRSMRQLIFKTQNQTLLCLQSLSLHTKSTRHKFTRTHQQKNNEEEEQVEEENFNGRANFQLHKSRGQHILTNPRVLDLIVKKSQVLSTDTVLEIGPGTGNLTIRLLESARKVVAVEIDERMVDALEKRVERLGVKDRLTIIAEDALKAHLPKFDLCIANIPYGISSPLIAKLLFGPTRPTFRSATLLLQKEFAQRLMAKPHDSESNRLAVNVGLVATVEFLMNVSKKDFLPCPKVDSSLVQIQWKPEIPDINLDEWLAFTRTCFSNRNKTLGAIFKQKKKLVELFSGISTSPCNSDEEDEWVPEIVGVECVDREDGLEVVKFKEKVSGILKMRGYAEKRPSKMSHEELLDLLQLFNQEGVLFNRQ